ncbi:hypothetical protein [Taibaiella koreensis]|uniref:hypothetical protein n=1 Tax=Taibaiella koreensis TaxID=1268548 RepID=UPI000E59C726|nr:hypothetical protein [Taibaiella koreensis]
MPRIDIFQSDIVAYTRIEPRVIARDYKPTVKAQVHDALWMLTQQWRVKEFKGEDAGTLVKARIQTQSNKINRFQSRKGPVEAFDENVPVEAKVERLPLKPDLALQLELGNIWFKLVAKAYPAQASVLFATFIEAFPIASLTPTSDAEKNSNLEAVKIRNLVTTRVMDGFALYQHIKNGGNATDYAPGYPDLDVKQVRFLQWLKNTYYLPADEADISWSEQQLEYQCAVSAPVTGNPGALQHVLQADKYKRGTVDWYSFDLNKDTNERLNETGTPIDNGVAVLNPETFSYIPHTIEFKGMPKGRWWEFEDKNNDLSKMLTQKQDVSKMVIMEFGLIYANDWFLIPHVVPDGTVNTVNGLVTTDVFGRHFLINRSGSGQDEQWQRWDMYNISRQGTANVSTFGKLLMVPSVKNRMEGEPLERVLFLRDEMANMVWGVEEVVPNELAGGMDGKNANNELQKYLVEQAGPPSPPPGYTPNDALHRFRLSNAVPENWIPFIPKQVPDPGSYQGREVLLQRAAMLRYIDNNYTTQIIRPRTDILSVGIAEGKSYLIHEEVLGRQGFVVSTNFQRTRWYDGATFTWTGRKVLAGKGEGNSGLKFDILADKEPDTP